MDNIRKALQIFNILMESGQLDRENENELFIEYTNPEVLEILNEFEDELDFKIQRINNTLYLIPNYDNYVLGFKTKDMREWIGSNARLSDVYLAYYIVSFLLYLFYGGKNKNPKQREFLRITAFVDELDKRIAGILNNKEEGTILEEKYSLNFIKLAQSWDARRTFEEKKMTTKHGFVLRVCKLLEQEKMVRIVDNDKEIRTTRKLDDLMLWYYLNDSRVKEINSVFAMGGSDNASD